MTESGKEKLVRRKEDWAREGRLLIGRTGDPAAERLPPGQHEVKTWPVLDLGIHPMLPENRWHLDIDGLVERPLNLKWQDFLALPQSESRSDIHCVTSWSRFDNRWRGLSARDLLAAIRPLPEARFVLFQSFDGYTTNLPLSAFADDDVLLATHWEGEPISREHGGPVRVVVPKHYFWKSAKWVKTVTFAAADRPGFWETRGYHNFADPWNEERYG